MRFTFANTLFNEMQKNDKIIFLTADIGYGIFDLIQENFSERFINVGASEQALIGTAVGLALDGKIPIAFTITPFLLYRPFELLRNYLHNETIPVKLVGSGRNNDYSNQGFSHWSTEDREILKVLSNIVCYYPNTKEEVSTLCNDFFYNNKPCYLNLMRWSN